MVLKGSFKFSHRKGFCVDFVHSSRNLKLPLRTIPQQQTQHNKRTNEQTTHAIFTDHLLTGSQTSQRRMADMTKMTPVVALVGEYTNMLGRHAEEMKKKDELHAEEMKKEKGRHAEEMKKEKARHAEEKEDTSASLRVAGLYDRCCRILNDTEKTIPGDVVGLKKITNNPTFTILEDEEGAKPTSSHLGMEGVKKCHVCPWIDGGSGTGYLRWVVGDSTYYLSGAAGVIYSAKTNKITDRKVDTHNLNHVRSKDMCRVGRALYQALVMGD